MICNEWLKSFELFYKWSIKNGWQKRLQIDRINNDGNYEPENCRFVSNRENQRNKRTNKIVEYMGKNYRLWELEKINNISFELIWKRVFYYKWPVQKAIYQKSERSK